LNVIVVNVFMAGTARPDTYILSVGMKRGIGILCKLTARPNVKNNDGTDG
jgi:hypothetical protein